MKRCRLIRLSLFLLALLFSCAQASAPSFQPSSEEDARRSALSLFCRCAFHPEYGGDESAPSGLIRWEREITVWAGGSPTREDLAGIDAFLAELNERVPGLPGIRRVRQDTEALVRIWYIPRYMMGYYLEEYVDGNLGFFTCEHPKGAILSARIGIASDAADQPERNHLLMEELVGALGLPGDHLKYSDSILYEPWTVTQSLSDVDWRMLNLLYSPAVSVGMTEEQARNALKTEMGI